MLADRFAVSTDKGIDSVARSICRAVADTGLPRAGALETMGVQFAELLSSPVPIGNVLEFLERNEAILRVAIGGGPRPHTYAEGFVDRIVWWTWRKHPKGPHALFAEWSGTSRTYGIEGFLFGSPYEPLFTDPSTPSEELVKCTKMAQVLRDVTPAPIRFETVLPSSKNESRPYPLAIHHLTVVASRRSHAGLAPSEMRVLREYTTHLQKMDVRTYDWLMDAAVRISSESRR